MSGDLFFSSDGHPGLGGKDIFFSKFSGTSWLNPVRLDPPINSKYDDFGIITDSLMNSGYFSSDRDKSIDIFYFKTNSPQIFYTDFQRENQNCFIFSDTGSIKIDSLKLKYEWDFGDIQKASGAIVYHCFRQSGKFTIRLNIIDRATNKLFFSKLGYNLELKEYVQPYIYSPDLIVRGDSVKFDASRSNLPGYKFMNYLWDFDEGSRLQGEIVQHTFSENGSFNVNLRVTLKSDVSGIISNKEISKKILVFDNKQEKDLFIAGNSSAKTGLSDIRNYDNALIKTYYSAEEAAKKDFLFGVVILSSKPQIAINSVYFRNIPRNYSISEIYDPTDSTYNYVVDRQLILMATYPAFRDMIASGFNSTCIKLFNILDPVEKELFSLLNTFGPYSDNYFDNYGRLNSNAYLFLDQIIKILNKYPQTKLEVEVYTDLSDYPDNSQNRAQSMVNYLINRGISSKRLAAKGYGSSRPVGLDRTEQDKRLNRRIGFSIINL
jgi:hypothetical protein